MNDVDIGNIRGVAVTICLWWRMFPSIGGDWWELYRESMIRSISLDGLQRIGQAKHIQNGRPAV